MYMVVLGVILLLLKYLEIGPAAGLEWWQALVPFGLAVLWWAWADWSGLTKRRAIDRTNDMQKKRMDQRRDQINPNRKKR